MDKKKMKPRQKAAVEEKSAKKIESKGQKLKNSMKKFNESYKAKK
jgi:hypothetical protein